MKCASTEPWQCGSDIAGGTNPLGAILCIRHLLAIIRPPRDPFTAAERVAMRPKYGRVNLGDREPRPERPRTLEIVKTTRVPDRVRLDAQNADLSPSYVELNLGVANDTRAPLNAHTVARRAMQAGFDVKATLAQTHVLVRCLRAGELVTFAWDEGRFTRSWHLYVRELDILGYREALAIVSAP